jgi:hypothetical protein
MMLGMLLEAGWEGVVPSLIFSHKPQKLIEVNLETTKLKLQSRLQLARM